MLFRDLKAYQHALRVAALSRPLINRLPSSERDLADQWRRASNSIVLNLAEGVTRKGSKEFRRFADIARGSLHEVEAILDLVQHLGFFQIAMNHSGVLAPWRLLPTGCNPPTHLLKTRNPLGLPRG